MNADGPINKWASLQLSDIGEMYSNGFGTSSVICAEAVAKPIRELGSGNYLQALSTLLTRLTFRLTLAERRTQTRRSEAYSDELFSNAHEIYISTGILFLLTVFCME